MILMPLNVILISMKKSRVRIAIWPRGDVYFLLTLSADNNYLSDLCKIIDLLIENRVQNSSHCRCIFKWESSSHFKPTLENMEQKLIRVGLELNTKKEELRMRIDVLGLIAIQE